jgi:short-subunit dehydrogenase
LARSKDELDQVLTEVGGRGAVVTADIGAHDEVVAAVAALTAELGPVDILVNNAGVGSYSAVADTDVEVYERLMRLNYLGTVYATKAVLPAMLQRGRGHIVNVGSIAGRIGAPFEAAYSASKFAVSGFTECLAVEVHSRGVGVSMVNPGPVQTGFFEARGVPYARKTPKPVPASDVAAAVIKAVEKDRLEQFVPAFLRSANTARHLLPGVYRWGTAKAFKDELGKR